MTLYGACWFGSSSLSYKNDVSSTKTSSVHRSDQQHFKNTTKHQHVGISILEKGKGKKNMKH